LFGERVDLGQAGDEAGVLGVAPCLHLTHRDQAGLDQLGTRSRVRTHHSDALHPLDHPTDLHTTIMNRGCHSVTEVPRPDGAVVINRQRPIVVIGDETIRASGRDERDIMQDLIKEFKEFVNRGNLIELAVAFTLTLFFVPVVNAIVDGVILNLIAGIFGEPSFDSIVVSVGEADLLIGTVITALVTFLLVALVCFVVVKAYNKMKGPGGCRQRTDRDRTAHGDPRRAPLALTSSPLARRRGRGPTSRGPNDRLECCE
jgi:large conductance mechanosensitive channel